jgi:hypothetical protein
MISLVEKIQVITTISRWLQLIILDQKATDQTIMFNFNLKRVFLPASN